MKMLQLEDGWLCCMDLSIMYSSSEKAKSIVYQFKHTYDENNSTVYISASNEYFTIAGWVLAEGAFKISCYRVADGTLVRVFRANDTGCIYK